jgi:archaellin
MQYTVLSNREDVRKVEAEQQYEFTVFVLGHLGIPEDRLKECFPEDGASEFDVNYKIKLRNLLKEFKVIIAQDRDGSLKIFVEDLLVAEWHKCKFKFKTDLSATDPEDRVYVEVICEWEIMFEIDEPEEE